MSTPKVSVLIPTYNYARYLPEAVDSILAQDFRDFELLISDDCSKDNSAGVIRAFAARDSRVRVQVHPANIGMVQNWNWCLTEAKGEYVKFVFGDDKLVGTQALSKLVALLDANPSAVLAASPRHVIDEDSKLVKVWDDFGKPGLRRGTDVIVECLGMNRNLIGEPSAVMFRRAAAARGFNARYNQLADQEMWFHLLARGDFAYAAEPLCAFRRHGSQQTKVNEMSRVGQKEGIQLFLEHVDRPYMAGSGLRQGLFAQVYGLRKHRRRNPGTADKELLETERALLRRLGWPWYGLHWLRRRMLRPFLDLARFGKTARHRRVWDRDSAA